MDMKPEKGLIFHPGFWKKAGERMERKLSYLIIEDDPVTVYILRHELEKVGFAVSFIHVQQAQDMEYALSSNHFDIIISDHYMPCFSSIEALKIRNNRRPQVPFIILTMDMPDDIRQEACLLGCDRVIDKTQIREVGHVITQLLDR